MICDLAMSTHFCFLTLSRLSRYFFKSGWFVVSASLTAFLVGGRGEVKLAGFFVDSTQPVETRRGFGILAHQEGVNSEGVVKFRTVDREVGGEIRSPSATPQSKAYSSFSPLIRASETST